jgi:hypothetical protein
VLPKEIGDKADIHTNDKSVLLSWKRDGEVCCSTIIKDDEFGDRVKGLRGPILEKVMARDAAK